LTKFTDIEMALIERADAFAEKAHAGQTRKYTGEPYIVHPRAVARIVATAGLPAEAVVAALLHDVIEDCEVGAHELRMLFGEEVAALVVELTNVSKGRPEKRAVRKEMDRKALALVSATAQSIKAADLVDNTKSIVEHDAGFARVYLKEIRALIESLTRADALLWEMAYQSLEKGEQKLIGEKHGDGERIKGDALRVG
jgi:(p)ppGpp synthase/HD superfamily hydrolase